MLTCRLCGWAGWTELCTCLFEGYVVIRFMLVLGMDVLSTLHGWGKVQKTRDPRRSQEWGRISYQTCQTSRFPEMLPVCHAGWETNQNPAFCFLRMFLYSGDVRTGACNEGAEIQGETFYLICTACIPSVPVLLFCSLPCTCRLLQCILRLDSKHKQTSISIKTYKGTVSVRPIFPGFLSIFLTDHSA